MKGLSERDWNPGMQRNGERPMDSALEERGLHPEWISLLAENSGMPRVLKTDLPLPTARILEPRGC